MTDLILSDNLELTNIAKMTANRIRHLKVAETDLMLSNIPISYRGAITRLIKELAAEPDEEKKKPLFESLGQMLEQVIFINMQAEVEGMLNNIPESLKKQVD